MRNQTLRSIAKQALGLRLPMPASDRFIYGTHETDNTGLHCVVQFDGLLDTKQLETALRMSFLVYPILGCCLIKEGPHWESLGEDALPNTLCVLNEEAAEKTDEHMLSFFANPLDACAGPQVKLLIIRSGIKDRLCLKLSHMASDAAGLRQYVHFLARLYTSFQEGSFHIPASSSNSRSMAEIRPRFSFKEKLQVLGRALLSSWQLAAFNNPWMQSAQSVAGASCRYVVCRLGAGRLEAMQQYARQYNGTINDLFLAAFYKAMSKICPTDRTHLPIRFTVDLRRHLKGRPREQWAIRNLPGVIGLTIPRSDVSDPGDLKDWLQVIVAKTRQMKSQSGLGLESIPTLTMLFDELPFWLYLRLVEAYLAPLRRRQRIAPVFTNLGILEAEDVQFANLCAQEAFLTASVPLSPFVFVSASSFADSAVLSIGYQPDAIDTQFVQRLLEAVDHALPKVSAVKGATW
jgi:NRPS condensation-like uncharacterized protein